MCNKLLIYQLSFFIRFRVIPTFGRDSIRKFRNNVSEMKRLGARDFENLLQVSTLFFFVYLNSD